MYQVVWLTGQGILFLLLVRMGKGGNGTTEYLVENATSISTASTSSEKSIEIIELNSTWADHVDAPNEIKNSTEIVIHERQGKAIETHSDIKILSQTSENVTEIPSSTTSTTIATTPSSTTEESEDSKGELNAKEANDEEQSVKEINGGDAPKDPATPKPFDPRGRRINLIEPRFLYVHTTKPPANERDARIQAIFGGECTHEIWNQCNRIKFWGGDYLVPDKKNPGQMLTKHHKIRCVESPDHTLCLKNGWTVARCHMLCMAQCNPEFMLNYEDLVLHEGNCKWPILSK